MVNLKATVRGNITQCILSGAILLAILTAFIFVPGMAPFIAVVLGIFCCMAVGAIILNIQELKRAKAAIERITESLTASPSTRTLQVSKVIFLTRPAPKYDEYLICALLQGPDKASYIYPFPKEVDGSAPIRKKLRLQLTGQPLTITCMGSTGVIRDIEGFSLDAYPTTAYRPTIFPRRNRKK